MRSNSDMQRKTRQSQQLYKLLQPRHQTPSDVDGRRRPRMICAHRPHTTRTQETHTRSITQKNIKESSLLQISAWQPTRKIQPATITGIRQICPSVIQLTRTHPPTNAPYAKTGTEKHEQQHFSPRCGCAKHPQHEDNRQRQSPIKQRSPHTPPDNTRSTTTTATERSHETAQQHAEHNTRWM